MIVNHNGQEITLPDIPTGMLEQYPYVVIVYDREAGKYRLVLSDTKWGYVDNTLIGINALGHSIVSVTDSACHYTFNTTGQTWDERTDYVPSSMGVGITLDKDLTVYQDFLWANHDVCYVTAISEETAEFGDEWYLHDVEFERVYLVPSDWLKRVATETRRLAGDTKRYNYEEMIAALECVPVPVAPVPMSLHGFTATPADASASGYIFSSTDSVSIAYLENGCRYRVEWDSASYECEAIGSDTQGIIGNLSLTYGPSYPNTGEPFLISTYPSVGMTSIFTTDSGTTHVVSIAKLP